MPLRMFSGDFRADAGNGVDEQPEQIPFRRRHETIKRVRVFADDKLREQFHVPPGGGSLSNDDSGMSAS